MGNSAFQKIWLFPLTRIVIGSVIMIVTIALAQYAAKFLFAGLDELPKNLLIAVFSAAAGLMCYSLLFHFYEKRKIVELSMDAFIKNASTGFIVGLALQSAVILVIYLAAGYHVLKINAPDLLIPGFAMGLSSAVTEEIILRGIVFRIIEEKLGTWFALLISALLFGFLHLGNANATIFSCMSIAIQAGILLAAAYVFSRSLWLPIFLHFAWNFAEAGIYGAAVSGNTLRSSLIESRITGPDLITGGAFGPENSIQATLFCLIAAACFLWRAKQNFVPPYWKNKSALSKVYE